MKHTSICLTNEMKAKVAATGRPMNTIVREALESYFSSGLPVEPADRKTQENFKRLLASNETRQYFGNCIREELTRLLNEPR